MSSASCRGLSERELPAPLSSAGLPRWRFSSRSRLGFLINLVFNTDIPWLETLGMPLVSEVRCCLARKSRAASNLPLASFSARRAESSEYPIAMSWTSACRARVSLSRPLDAEDAELTPLVVERVETVEAALDPSPLFSPP